MFVLAAQDMVLSITITLTFSCQNAQPQIILLRHIGRAEESIKTISSTLFLSFFFILSMVNERGRIKKSIIEFTKALIDSSQRDIALMMTD